MTRLAASEAARFNVRPLLGAPGPALREELLRLGGGVQALPALARHGAVEAMAVAGLAPDQLRVLEREAGRLGGAVLSSDAGDRAVVLASLSAMGELPARLADFGRRTESLGQALAEALAGKGTRGRPVPAGAHRLPVGEHTLVMGVVNVTPDSFSGDGIADDVDAAVDLGVGMAEAGADLVDVGGESTRPHSAPVSAAEELRRVLPVVEALATRITVPVSIDSRKAEVAAAAVSVGASVVNDVWGLRGDPRMAEVCAGSDVAVVLMHNQGQPDYEEVVADVCAGLRQSLAVAAGAGVPSERLIVDPGLGFAKGPAHNLELIRRLGELRGLGRPILVGVSRKSTVTMLLEGLPAGAVPGAGASAANGGADLRTEGSIALAVLAAQAGADIVRTHDVPQTVRALRAADAVIRGTPPHLRDRPPPGPTG